MKLLRCTVPLTVAALALALGGCASSSDCTRATASAGATGGVAGTSPTQGVPPGGNPPGAVGGIVSGGLLGKPLPC